MAGQHRSLTCPRCSGQMETGFIVDEGYGSRTAAQWVEGEPEKSIWVGIKLRGKRKLSIATYRCRRCAYLESYA